MPDAHPLPRDAIAPLLERGYRYALALTHDRPSAEDLLHDAWIKVLQHDRAHSIPYLIATIRNHWIDRMRRQAIVPMVPLQSDVVASKPSADRALAIKDEVGRALGTLTPDEREVLFLNAAEGWTAAEIGELTGRSRNTILTILARARHRIGSWRDAQTKLEVL